MKHKVSELEGALLDAAVAKAAGYRWELSETLRGPYCFAAVPDLEHGDGNGLIGFSPSQFWESGGPIIERERITVAPLPDPAAVGHLSGCLATVNGRTEHGDTYLVSAMRAYVASKVGNEVELP
ncbi:phage protein NinX family protein [Roseateles sp.]|uniref:phage protein NinX family protein n=1 Tax=Roseateles sp. TaxID=1971397 RepID=UPI002F402622